MPKTGYVSITITTDDSKRLLEAADDLMQHSPVSVESLSPAQQLRLLLDYYENSNKEPEEEDD